MRKALSIGIATAASLLICSTAFTNALPGLEPMRASNMRMAQAPGEPPVSSRRTINLTEEDRHTLREIVLKDAKVEKAPDNTKVSIGDAVPQGVHMQPVPEDVTRKVPQLKNNTFFVKGEEIVIVEPKDNTVADIVK